MSVEEYFGRWMKVIDMKEMARVLNTLGKINLDKLDRKSVV